MMQSFGFALFVMVTGVLVLRPADLAPALADLRLYEVTAMACLMCLLPQVTAQLSLRALKANPVTVCVLGLLVATPLSFVYQSDLSSLPEATLTFLKVTVSYLLLTAAIHSAARLRSYLAWFALWLMVMTALCLLQYHGVIDNPELAPKADWVMNSETGVREKVWRLSGVGVFGNPNNLAQILVTGMLISFYFLASHRSQLWRWLWLAPLGGFGYALFLTYSRGGFVSLLIGLLVLLYQRLGGIKAVVLGALALPALFYLFGGGRQTDLNIEGGTGQQRIQLWSDGFLAVRSSPLFGIGVGKYPELTGGLGAHNSFVHAYVETGLLGGTLFLGAFYLSLTGLYRLRDPRMGLRDPDLVEQRSCLLAILVSYAVNLLGSSRNYDIPTYLLLGLATVYLRLATQHIELTGYRLSLRLVARIAAVSLITALVLQGVILAAVNWNGP